MDNFANVLANYIIKNETPRLNQIMKYVGNKIQGDIIGVTYAVVDAFYSDYSPTFYIRTDVYKHPRGKNGRFKKKGKRWGAARNNDISLQSAIKAFKASGEPAIGINQPLEGVWGYQAGVFFDEGYFNSNMKHGHKGFTEWDIAEDFLWGVHGNESVATTTPPAGEVLYDYIASYKPIFDKHYNNALRKFK